MQADLGPTGQGQELVLGASRVGVSARQVQPARADSSCLNSYKAVVKLNTESRMKPRHVKAWCAQHTLGGRERAPCRHTSRSWKCNASTVVGQWLK